jgi:hypothetical protein
MNSPAASEADLISFAIDRGICVLAVYNRSETVLAPHSLFERNGEPFLKAVTLETEGRTPKALRMGIFKLAGLTDMRLSGRTFSAEPLLKEVEATRRRLAKARRD